MHLSCKSIHYVQYYDQYFRMLYHECVLKYQKEDVQVEKQSCMYKPKLSPSSSYLIQMCIANDYSSWSNINVTG